MVIQEHQHENGLAEIRVVSETVEFKPPRPPPPYSLMPPTPQAEIGTPKPTVIQNTIIVQQVPLRTSPVLFDCPICKTRVETRVNLTNTRKTHLMAGFICGVTL
ncbi:hypothetical protein EVAR_9454_1 [Eumeta japonica]|uniref:LITAF domain-containing protein n=1 Tax=Eumeta variegata TaxID=151549 RepID=A0A4C1UEH6_EUMVA|nr:hypothetical protein EVAR_9454_1 [Eumeta japonica]